MRPAVPPPAPPVATSSPNNNSTEGTIPSILLPPLLHSQADGLLPPLPHSHSQTDGLTAASAPHTNDPWADSTNHRYTHKNLYTTYVYIL